MVSKRKFKTLSCILDRVWERISNWKAEFLLQASKEVLIKVVVDQAIQSYHMSLFKIPRCLLSDIKKMVQDFWWDHHQEKEKTS